MARSELTVKKFVVNAGDAGRPFSENTYVLSDPDTGDAVLIDPGAADPRIAAYIAKSGLRPRKILYTHSHDDHTGGGRHFADLYKIAIAAPRGEKGMFSPGADLPSEWLEPDAAVSLGSLNLRVLATPGHTPGGACFQAGNHLFAGDTLFQGSIGKPYGQTEGERARHEAELVAVIRDKLLVLPPATWVYPGHGPSTTIMDEEAGNPFLKKH
jgi:hydroxyacylglutathione hydrolase